LFCCITFYRTFVVQINLISMATINFLFRSNKERASLTLRLLYRFEGVDYVFAGDSKIIVTKDYWNKGFKEAISERRNSDVIIHNRNIEASQKQSELKNKLSHIESYIIDEFNKSNPAAITKDWLKNQITNYYNPKKNEIIPTDLVSFFDYYLTYRKNELNAPSIMKYNTIKDKLKEFQTFRKHTIYLTDVNDSFKNEFIDYYKSKNYAHNTTQREFSFIKTVCKKAKFLGLEVSHQLEGLTIKSEKVEGIYLTFEELDKINDTTPINENFEGKLYLAKDLEIAKDWLLISAYCGQRVSDFMRFKTDMIRTENEQMFIEFTQKKTGKIMTIPLHTKIIEILNKRGFQFPDRLEDQYFNRFVKVVCKQAGIDNEVYGGLEIGKRKVYGMYKKYQLATSKTCGRRSFASNNYGIIPTSHLIYITGHSSEAMFLNYIGKSNKDLAVEIAKYFK
jgi:integrase